VDFSIKRNCPKCGRDDVKLIASHDEHGMMDPLRERPPIATVSSYECECGARFVDNTPHDGANKSSGP